MSATVFSGVVQLLLLGVFGHALYAKGKSVMRFQAVLSAYELLPHTLLKPLAYGLVGLELVVIVALCLWPKLGLLLAALTLAIYLSAMAINLWRDREFIDCGCGDEPTRLSSALLIRNGALITLSLSAYGMWLPPSWGLAMFLTIAGLGLLVIGIYFTAEQLLVNRSKHIRLWLGEA